MDPESIYLDHNASAPIDPDVLEAMRPYFLAAGNAESRHTFGRRARRAIETAKETIAQILAQIPLRSFSRRAARRRIIWRSSGSLVPSRRPGTLSLARLSIQRSLNRLHALKLPVSRLTSHLSIKKDSSTPRRCSICFALRPGLRP